MKGITKFTKNDYLIFILGVFFITIGIAMLALNMSTGFAFDFPKGFLLSTIATFATMFAGIILISTMKWKGERVE